MNHGVVIRAIFGVFTAVCLFSELFALNPLISPFGTYGMTGYVRSLLRMDDRKLYLHARVVELEEISSMEELNVIGEEARARFKAEGGLSAYRKRMLKRYEEAYDQSRRTWPALFALLILSLVGYGALFYRERRLDAEDVEDRPRHRTPKRQDSWATPRGRRSSSVHRGSFMQGTSERMAKRRDTRGLPPP